MADLRAAAVPREAKGVPVSDVRFDPDWVGGYAAVAAKSAEALGEGAKTVGAAPLTEETFGRLGRTMGTTEAYAGAAGLLRDQLDRAVEALGSAATTLQQVTSRYQDSEDEAQRTLGRAERQD